MWYTADVATDNALTPTTESTALDLWDALKAGNPGLAVATIVDPSKQYMHFDAYPGFKPWIISELALGWPSKRIAAHLADLREEQQNDGVQPWPVLNHRDIDAYRSDWREEWLPVRARLSQQIENVGVLAKNNRLMTLARVADELEDMMWTERNTKSGQLYLIPEFRQTLRQIAEEKGELGEDGRVVDNTLFLLAEALSNAMKVQGSGVQPGAMIDLEFDYHEDGPAEQTPVSSESRSLQTDEVQAD